jgi:hypothetical protein
MFAQDITELLHCLFETGWRPVPEGYRAFATITAIWLWMGGEEGSKPGLRLANSSHDFRRGYQIKEGNATDILNIMLSGMF